MRNVFEMIHNFRLDRPVMDAHNQDLGAMMDMLQQEMHELRFPAQDGMSQEQYIRQELADIAIFSITMLQMLGNPEDEIAEKVLRNCLKYPAELFQGDLDYDEAIKQAKANWGRSENREFYS